MASVVYQCSTTGLNVQAWFDDDAPADDSLTYVPAPESISSTGTVRRWVMMIPDVPRTDRKIFTTGAILRGCGRGMFWRKGAAR